MGSSPSLHRFKIKRNPDCVYEERDVDARHYVLDCPRVVGVQEERRRARGAIESKLLRNHSKLLEKAYDVASELYLNLIVAVYACGVDVEKGPIRQQLWNAPPCDNVESWVELQRENNRSPVIHDGGSGDRREEPEGSAATSDDEDLLHQALANCGSRAICGSLEMKLRVVLA
ncbi:hypothetical protein LAZ67_22000404 [Cordylochernes scorpioides]|uniref:Reverse transcriptase n=1 Tax=Cordylochernes scorpioides TaxID=51811 RepID=A0ABY6LSE9_9ARAC|nr:hypothetical protein LAZ67_22000404 [Cordylochernes scorpioides]